jgi:carboxypeptidase PM20D1
MKRVAVAVGLALAVVAAVVLARTVRARAPQVQAVAPPHLTVDPNTAQRLAGALRLQTVSYHDRARTDVAQLLELHRYLAARFPLAHQALQREVVAQYSLLYTWTGSDPALPPVLLLSHMDVVPVEAGTEEAWTHPPFAGEIADGYVWGRGAMDDKVGVLGILEAVDTLVRQGFRPRRTVYLAFGHDEEIGGWEGAAAIAELLRTRGVRPDWVLDEGGAVTTGVVPGVAVPVAMIGIAEKGFLSLELVVAAEGGHSSMPPPETAVGILSAAVVALERHPMPSRIAGPTRRFLEAIGPASPFTTRLALANLWLLGPLVERQLAGSPRGSATIRTTTAPTMLEGSIKDNVLPARARAVVNFRILPGDSVDAVVRHARDVVADPRVTIAPFGQKASEPSPESPAAGPAYDRLAGLIRGSFPGALVAPTLVIGATDARHYAGLSPNVYRFLPWSVDPDDLKRIHGTNERLAVPAYENAVRFYAALIRLE